MKLMTVDIGALVAQAFKNGFDACARAYAMSRAYDRAPFEPGEEVIGLAATVDDRPRAMERARSRRVARVPGDLEANLDAFRSDLLDALHGAVIVGTNDRPTLYEIVVAVRDLVAIVRGSASALAERDQAREEAARAEAEKQAAIDHACKLVDDKTELRDRLELLAMAPDLGTLVKIIGQVVDGDRVTKLGQAWFPIATMTSPDGSPFTAQDLDLLATACHQVCAANGKQGGAWFTLARRCESLAKMLRGAGT